MGAMGFYRLHRNHRPEVKRCAAAIWSHIAMSLFGVYGLAALCDYPLTVANVIRVPHRHIAAALEPITDLAPVFPVTQPFANPSTDALARTI